MGKKSLKLQFNMGEMNDLLRDFYTITKIRMIIFDDQFERVAAYPAEHSQYCEILRNDIRAKEACRECDMEGCKACKKLGKGYMYECHAGLIEVVTPLMDGDITIGYLIMGQVLLDDGLNRKDKWEKLFEKVRMYNIDFEKLESCFWRKRRMTKQTLSAAVKIMEACASHLYLTKSISVQEEDLSNQIQEYIVQHLVQDLTVDEICEKFGMKKTKLYQISKHGFGDGIAQHIRNLRIRKAEELLTETDKKISDIAEEVGISDYNYFTKVFKKAKGVTPREFRKIYTKDH